MRFPTPTYAAGPALPSLANQGLLVAVLKPKLPVDTDGWSSLIGIVTAICGNILISIALNTQRYAHIKLNEQHAERRRLLRRAERRQVRTGLQTTSVKERERAKRKRIVKKPVNGDDAEQEPLLASFRADLEDDYTVNDEDQDSGSDAKSEGPVQKSYLRSLYWWAGIIMMTVGEAGNFLAYGFAPASIVSPLGVVAIISNCIIAPFFMGERFRWRDLAGVLIAVAGAVTVVLSASDNNPKLGPHEIWALISRWEFETYLGVSSLVIICLMLASNKYGDKSIFIDLGLVGLFGGYTALSTKGVASMLSYTLFRALTFPVTYLLVTILVFTAVMQIKYVNRALQRFDATQVIPTQFVMFTLSVILGSAILYRDFERTRGDDAGKFIGGCALTFMGVWLITSGRGRPSDEEEGFDDEDEDAIVLRDGEQYQDDIPTNGSHPSLHPVVESSDEDGESNGRSLRGHDSDVSLPETLRRNHWDSSSPSVVSTPRRFSTTLYGASQESSMEDPSSPLLENPWQGPQETTVKPKSSLRRLLEPLTTIFPSQRSQPRPAAPGPRHSAPQLHTDSDGSNPIQSLPHTPRHQNQYAPNNLHPQTPHTDGAHSHRTSLATIYPGAFTSPLSSSLSAIVADSLRRGPNFSRLRSRRTGRPRLPNMPDSHTGRQRGNSDTTDAGIHAVDVENAIRAQYGESPSALRHTRSHDIHISDSASSTTAGSGRRRSLSTRIGDFLHLNRSKPSVTEDSSTAGEGPS